MTPAVVCNPSGDPSRTVHTRARGPRGAIVHAPAARRSGRDSVSSKAATYAEKGVGACGRWLPGHRALRQSLRLQHQRLRSALGMRSASYVPARVRAAAAGSSGFGQLDPCGRVAVLQLSTTEDLALAPLAR